MLWQPAHSATPPEWNAWGVPLANSSTAASARNANPILNVLITNLRSMKSSPANLRLDRKTSKQFRIQAASSRNKAVKYLELMICSYWRLGASRRTLRGTWVGSPRQGENTHLEST